MHKHALQCNPSSGVLAVYSPTRWTVEASDASAAEFRGSLDPDRPEALLTVRDRVEASSPCAGSLAHFAFALAILSILSGCAARVCDRQASARDDATLGRVLDERPVTIHDMFAASVRGQTPR